MEDSEGSRWRRSEDRELRIADVEGARIEDRGLRMAWGRGEDRELRMED